MKGIAEFRNIHECLNVETIISTSRCFTAYFTRVIGSLWDSVNYLRPMFQMISLLCSAPSLGTPKQLTTVSLCGRSVYMWVQITNSRSDWSFENISASVQQPAGQSIQYISHGFNAPFGLLLLIILQKSHKNNWKTIEDWFLYVRS
jgi:hypothetical protein